MPKLRNPLPEGPFRRAILLRRDDPAKSHGWVEDDFHHFGVSISHRDGLITNVTAVTRRAPWSTCAAAASPLRALEGQPLRGRASDVGMLINMRLQCTHMFDLAGLVMAFAWRGGEQRLYEVEVPNRPMIFDQGRVRRTGLARVSLRRDGAPAMEWDVEDEDIVGPSPHGGHSLNEGFRAWTETLPVEEAEQAFVLRRAILVASGRGIDLDRVETAAQAPLPPVCHTFRGRLEDARRIKGSLRDFGTDDSAMLASSDEIP